MWWQLLFVVLVAIGSPLGSEAAGEGLWPQYCDSPGRDGPQTRELLAHADTSPLPIMGSFPDRENGVAGAAYAGDPLSDGRMLQFYLDGVLWVTDVRALNLDIEMVEPLAFSKFAEITYMLEGLRNCGQVNNGLKAIDFLTDFGVQWVFGSGDPFLVAQSPFSVFMDPGASAAADLPTLGVVEAKQLSDGRAALIVAEPEKNPEVASAFVSSSIWILVQGQDGWKIDGIVGALRTVAPSYVKV